MIVVTFKFERATTREKYQLMSTFMSERVRIVKVVKLSYVGHCFGKKGAKTSGDSDSFKGSVNGQE